MCDSSSFLDKVILHAIYQNHRHTLNLVSRRTGPRPARVLECLSLIAHPFTYVLAGSVCVLSCSVGIPKTLNAALGR